jgi:hypothetical protein
LGPGIWVNSTSDGGTWAGWSVSSGGGLTNAPLAGVSFASGLHLFAKGLDLKIYQSSTGDGLTWTAWGVVPDSGLTNTSLTGAVFLGRLYLFAKGLDSRIYMEAASPAP